MKKVSEEKVREPKESEDQDQEAATETRGIETGTPRRGRRGPEAGIGGPKVQTEDPKEGPEAEEEDLKVAKGDLQDLQGEAEPAAETRPPIQIVNLWAADKNQLLSTSSGNPLKDKSPGV